MKIPINNISYSIVNGPGYRLVIWVQGCKLNCKGCFNPETHPYSQESLMNIDEIALMIRSNSLIEGITISGGEPLDYLSELSYLLSTLDTSLTVIIFTGYTVNEIVKDLDKLRLTQKADLVISGRYNFKLKHPYLGKKIMNITGRVDYSFFKPVTAIEYSVNQNKVTKTGVFKAP